MNDGNIERLLYGILMVIDLLLFIRILYIFFGVESWLLLAPVIYAVTYVLLFPLYAFFPDLSRITIGFDTGAFGGILLYSFLVNTAVLFINMRGKKPTLENVEQASEADKAIGLADKLQDEVTKVKKKVSEVEIPKEPSSSQEQTQEKRAGIERQYPPSVQPSGGQSVQPSGSSDQQPSQSKRRRHRRRKNKQPTRQQKTQSTELWPENTPVKIEDE